MPYTPPGLARPATVSDKPSTLNMQGFWGNDLLVRLNLLGDEAVPAVTCVARYNGRGPYPADMQPGVEINGRTATIRFVNTKRYQSVGTVDISFGDRIVLSGTLGFDRTTVSSQQTGMNVNVAISGGAVVNVTVLVGASAGGGSLLSDLNLSISTNGQTRWNIGGGELRRGLFYNGVKMTKGTDYSITLPYLDWLSPVPIETSDELTLTN